jgi:hypothetical protein
MVCSSHADVARLRARRLRVLCGLYPCGGLRVQVTSDALLLLDTRSQQVGLQHQSADGLGVQHMLKSLYPLDVGLPAGEPAVAGRDAPQSAGPGC